MNSAIMQWSSDAMYHGELTADASVADHLLELDEEALEKNDNEDITDF